MSRTYALAILTVLSFVLTGSVNAQVKQTPSQTELGADRKRVLEAIQAAKADAQRQLREANERLDAAHLERDKQDRLSWAIALHKRIEANWLRSSSEKPENYPCAATVKLLPTGVVADVSFDHPCSEFGYVEKSIETAILKSSPLPLPTNSSTFSNTLVLRFSPSR